MKFLKEYQVKAVNDITDAIKSEKKKIIFKSPTGSGKTFMMANVIKEISTGEDFLHKDFCFLWLSIGKGELHEQSYSSLKNELGSSFKISLLEQEFHGGREEIYRNEIVVSNWEKLRAQNKDGEWSNVIMRDRETYNFPDVVRITRETDRQIILIIDESHHSAKTERVSELLDVIQPNYTIEMSATPHLRDYDIRIWVKPEDVISEGVIKKEIIINQDIDKIDSDENTSLYLILDSAYKKRLELKKLYKKNEANINPLAIVQIPNAEDGEAKQDYVENFLRNKGISRDKRNLAIWLTADKEHNEKEWLTPGDSNVDFLIFKQAIDTGWDCPRAQILVKLREVKSFTFEIQTVGRILRMPEAKHYDSESLNKAYVYTNLQEINTKNEEYNPNILKTLKSVRTTSYTDLKLKSFYRNRTDFGDILSSFKDTLEDEFCKYFKIKKGDYGLFGNTKKQMESKGFEFDVDGLQDELILNEALGITDIDEEQNIKPDSVFVAEMETGDLSSYLNQKIIGENLNGFAYKRSYGRVKTALLTIVANYLNEGKLSDIVLDLIFKNRAHITKIINTATLKYKNVRDREIENKEKENAPKPKPWEIECTRYDNKDSVDNMDYKKYVYKPCRIRKDSNEWERSVMDYLDGSDKVDFWWQNGSAHDRKNFGIKYERQNNTIATFQPDFIVRFKDGRVGIFDPKSNDEEIIWKQKALQKFITTENKKGMKLFGGMITKHKDKLLINMKSEYKKYDGESLEDWRYLDEVL